MASDHTEQLVMLETPEMSDRARGLAKAAGRALADVLREALRRGLPEAERASGLPPGALADARDLAAIERKQRKTRAEIRAASDKKTADGRKSTRAARRK